MQKLAFILVCTGLFSGGLAAQESQERPGYRIFRNQVLVEEAAHWRQWESPIGVRLIDGEDGTVSPRFMRRAINASTNVAEFTSTTTGDTLTGGISAVGVRADTLTAPLAFDGDMATYWEPDWAANLDNDLDNLWIEMDLGRAVIAERIVVRFVDDGEGDPFLKFRVLISDGSKSFGSRKKREFLRAGQISRPNKEQREFSFDLKPLRKAQEGIEGAIVQFVRIDLLDTDGIRAREVEETRYAFLADEDKGAIDHFRRTVAGREIQVVEETYNELPEEERGAVRHYRRERPRLAELGVPTLGDNIVPITQQALFAEGDFFDDIAKRFVTDGLFSSEFGIQEYNRLKDKNQIFIDLGGKFWLDRIRLLSLRDPFNSYQIRISDGARDATSEFLWHSFDEQLNQAGFLQFEERFSLREVQYIEVRRLNLLGQLRGGRQLSEIQAYGEGYVSEMTMASPIIQLDQRRMFAGVNWEGEAPVGTRLEIRTRSGDDLLQIPHYYRRDGREVSETLYNFLRDEDKGITDIEFQEGPDWSPWSEPYEQPGDAFKSPTPRRHTRVRVSLRTTEPLRFATIRRLSLDLAAPLVDSTIAEIWPIRNVKPGAENEFRLYFNPLARPDDLGFTRLRLTSSSSAPIELVELRLGTDDQLRFGGATPLWPGPVQVEPLETGDLELVFLEPIGADTDVLELRFRTRVFLPSTTFGIQLSHPDRPNVVQTVDPGDASALQTSNSLVVVSDLRDFPLLGELSVQPPLFTPNGDGINDVATIRLSVFQVEGERSIRVRIRDLAGRPLRDLSLRRDNPSGEHSVTWDGRDREGHLVAPGIYLVHISLPTDADARGTDIARTINLAY